MWTSNAVLAALVAGAASAATEERDVPAFDSVHVASGIRATITVGPRKPVHLEADRAVLDAIETRVEGGTLHIGFKRHSRVWNTGEILATVQTPELHAVGGSSGAMVRATFTRSDESAISASAGSQVHVRGIDARRLAVEASGGGAVDVAGRAELLELRLSGGSHLDGRQFEAVDVDVQGSGGAVADVKASGKVRGSLSGGSEMHVRGNAKTRVATSGGSEILVDD
jgi:Putative auto-transporter adhesin, head GIN domain